jgi:hypoxanthine phosphoribosyltransferase
MLMRSAMWPKGVLKGSFMFMSDLVRHFTFAHRIEFMAVSSYGDSTSSTSVRIIMDVRRDIAGEHVLVIEDIIDSGRTLHFLQNLLAAREPASIKTAVFLNKKDNRNWMADVDYLGFESPNHWLVGYGLDYAEQLRTLPYVGILKQDIYAPPTASTDSTTQ